MMSAIATNIPLAQATYSSSSLFLSLKTMKEISYLRPKLLYITLYCILGSAIPYLSIFYSDNLHLTSQQIGFILAIAPFIQSISCPFWTLQVDKYPAWHGRLMAILMLIGGTSIMSLMFIPYLLPNDKSIVTLVLTSTFAIIFAFFGQPVVVLVDSAVLKILGEHKIYYGDQRLWGSVSNAACILFVGYLIGLLGINNAFYLFGISVTAFLCVSSSTTVVNQARNIDDPDEYEPLMSPPNRVKGYYLGYPADGESPHPIDEENNTLRNDTNTDTFASDLRPCDSIASSQVNTIYYSYDHSHLLHPQITTSNVVQDVQEESNMLLEHQTFPSLGLVLSNIPTVDTSLAVLQTIDEHPGLLSQIIFGSPRIYTFLCMALLFGISYSMVAQFLFLFLKNELHIAPTLIGWTGPIGGVTEVGTFYVSRILLKSFSVSSLVLCSHLALICRNAVYMFLVPDYQFTAWIALSMQLLNGFSFALIWCTCVSEVDSIFPDNQRAMGQGILAALFSGLGFGIGCLCGGYFYDTYGSNMLFVISISIACLSMLIFSIGRFIKSR
ncbi:major facilitator superfamily domain-containing protein [Pilobolus umbonatus]|nr:major facilitator superfamily domain-containing protein [Pilobolus umbonatus]